METKTKSLRWLLSLLSAFMLFAGLTASCSKSDDEPVPDVEVGESVKDFQKVVRYEDSKYFDNDLDAFVTYSLDIRAVRWAYIYRASKGFDGNEPFCATIDEMENDEYCKTMAEILYTIIDEIVERADQYEEAIERLRDSGVLTMPNASTRGVLSDAWDFMFSCKKTQTMGRKSVVTIMRELGWTNNAAKLQQIYNDLPSSLRRDYSNSQDFWRDFSAGKIDSRANQVFVNMYNYADPEFGDKARDLDITPGKNITVAGAELIEKGAALVIDACPISTEVGYGKDLYGAVNATSDLVTKGDVKGFMQNAANNLINYGRDVTKLADKMRGLDINYWDYGDKFWDYVGKDFSTVLMNDVCFNEHFGELDNGEGLIPNMVRTKDVNGKEITLLVMVDTNSGQTTITCVFDKDGNIVVNPQLPGQKQITVVNRQTGKRITKTITVPEKGETEVEVDLEFDEIQLDENPKDGFIEIRPQVMSVNSNGSRYKAMIVTNYLYYTCTTKDDWLSCSIAKDANLLYFSTATNDTGKERKGHITVSATDSKGKVLKSTVFTVEQQIPEKTEYWVSASPSTLQFDGGGGTLESVIDHSYAFNHLDVDWSDELSGWATIDWKETATGWKIVVDASANNTGEERSGTITVYAGASNEAIQNAKNGNFNPDLVAMTTILVKQEVNQENPNLTTDVQSIHFSADIDATASDGSKITGVIEWGGFVIDQLGQGERFEKKDITVTPTGNSGSFQCMAVYDKTYDDTSGKTHKEKAKISFTIDQPKNGFYGIAKNLEYTYEEEVYYRYYDFTVKTKENLSADNIPVSWTSESGKSVIWSGGAEEGVKMNSYYHSCVVDYKGETKQNLSFSSTDYFKLSLSINFAK